MKQSMSNTRRDYEAAYKRLRLYTCLFHEENPFRSASDAESCALESYDYHDSHFSGWINRQRMFKFHERSETVATAGSWPF